MNGGEDEENDIYDVRDNDDSEIIEDQDDDEN